MQHLFFKNLYSSLILVLVLTGVSSSLAQVSIIEQLSDFVKNESIEFFINDQQIGEQIPIYAENQNVGFSILSKTSGYHYLYVVDGQGQSTLIYPNQYEPAVYIQADQQASFPSNDGYRLIAQQGQGTDFHIVSIVSPTPLTGFTIGFTNGFNIVPPATQVIPSYQSSAMRYRVQASTQTADNCSASCVYLNPQATVTQQQPVFIQTTNTATTNTPSTSTALTTTAITANPTTTSTANSSSTGPFQGFASYQAYLDNFYSQNGAPTGTQATSQTSTSSTAAATITPTPIYTYTPTSTTSTQTTTNTAASTGSNYSVPNYAASAGLYQGFSSYQAYLDNYYAQNGGSSQTTQTATTPAITNIVSTTQIAPTPVTVYTSPIGSGQISSVPTTTITNTATGAFQGFSSYQAYLDNFYAQLGNTSPTTNQVSTTTGTGPFQGFDSYDAYLSNYLATVGASGPGNNFSVNTVITNQSTQAPNYAVNYGITQLQLQDANGVSYTQLSPQFGPLTAPQNTTANQPVAVNTNYTQPGFFDFEVARNYTLFQSVGLRVISIQDNRCPAGVQCVQAGNITATVELEFANARRSFTITILPGDEPIIGVGNTSLRFIGLSNSSNTALRVFVATR